MAATTTMANRIRYTMIAHRTSPPMRRGYEVLSTVTPELMPLGARRTAPELGNMWGGIAASESPTDRFVFGAECRCDLRGWAFGRSRRRPRCNNAGRPAHTDDRLRLACEREGDCSEQHRSSVRCRWLRRGVRTHPGEQEG